MMDGLPPDLPFLSVATELAQVFNPHAIARQAEARSFEVCRRTVPLMLIGFSHERRHEHR